MNTATGRSDSFKKAFADATDPWFLSDLLRETARSAEYEALAGEAPTAYGELLQSIDRAIGGLKRFRAQAQALSQHSHLWDENDYCVYCGADGRA